MAVTSSSSWMAALFLLARTLFGLLAALHFQRRALLFGERGANLAAHGARGAQFPLFAVQAFSNGTVGRQAPPLAIDTGVDAASVGLLRPRARPHQAGNCPHSHDPRPFAQLDDPSLTPYRWR